MLTTLTLKRAPAPVRDPVAWFLPGEDAALWLEEITRWSVPADTIGFYLIAGTGDIKLVGALAVPPAGARVPIGGRAQPFGLAAPGIFLPVDALVWPPASADELRAAVNFPVLIFHPAHGVTGSDVSDQKRAWDLLAPPAVAVGEDWSAARAGALSMAGLGAVRLKVELSLDDLFGEESADIGSEAADALPPSPNEPGNSLASRTVGGAAAILVTGLLGLTSLLPRTARAPTWVNALESWAQSKLAGVTRDIERRRHRELHRLLALLESNPEEGLRHAIPLTALANRGITAASARLGRRFLDFDLGRLGGGRAADFWNVPDAIRTSLSKSYRESAMREMKLGRHRRAAFIFAELLGDFAAAADALKQGRHFREAALLYRERLRNPLAAAACFAEGGLVVEALAIYVEQGRWLEVADLQARLGDREAERAAVRRAVDALQTAGDTVAAARLIETRLDAPDEALAVLAATWPRGRQALVCLEERFALLARRQRHDDARELLAAITKENTPLPTLSALTGLLAKIFETTTDLRVRHAAADAVRIKASLGLAGHPLEKSDELGVLRALTRLAPEDRLLARDAQRFRESRPKPVATSAFPPASTSIIRRVVVEKGGTLSLPRVRGWSRVGADATGFYAVAQIPPSKVFFSRGSWSHEIQSADWSDPAPDRGTLFLLVPHLTSIVVARPFAPRLEPKLLPGTDGFAGVSCMAGTPPWLPDDTVQAASSRFALWVVRVVGSRVVLAIFQGTQLVDSRDVTDELIAAGATGGGTSLVLDALGSPGRVALGYGNHLLVREQSGELTVSDLGSRITGLLPAPARTPGWVALLERGAVFVSANQNRPRILDDQMEMPRGAFLGDERLVLVGGEEGLVVRLLPAGMTRVACFALTGGAGIALTCTAHPQEFAVFSETGSVQRWRLPP